LSLNHGFTVASGRSLWTLAKVVIASPNRSEVQITALIRTEKACSAECDQADFPRSYDGAMTFERITSDPERMGGVPCIRDLRLTVSTVLGRLAGGDSADDLLAEYPYLEREDIVAALKFAAAVVNEHEVTLARPA